jgi:hypothetical protein
LPSFSLPLSSLSLSLKFSFAFELAYINNMREFQPHII